MKRIKLLMPLTGVAAVSAAAFPLTACGGDSSTVLVTGITLSDTNASIGKGASVTLTATVSPSNATNKTLSWSSSNTSVATVSNGVVTGVAAGTATIKATSTDGSNISASASITVQVIQTTSILLIANDEFTVNNKTNITAAVFPTSASNKSLTWKSDNTQVATVSNGVVTGVAAGKANITATATDGSGVSSDPLEITVTEKALNSITFTPSSYSVKAGNSLTLNPTFEPYNASNKTISWSSNSESVATVNNSGVVQGVAAGTATITAQCGTITQTCTVEVKDSSAVEQNKQVTADATLTGDYESTTSDANAICISNGATVSLTGSTINKSGATSSSEEDVNFKGINSSLLAKGGAKVTLSGVNITSEGKGANGTFSYGGTNNSSNATGDGTTIEATYCFVTTTGSNSGGYMTAGDGTTKLTNCSAVTSGNSSAAIRTDRGGGTVTVNGGSFKSTGVGSPSIYSTATIDVTNATLETTASEGVIVEGKNSISLTGCTLLGNNTTINGSHSTVHKNVFLYQSASGDAEEGNSTFTAKNSVINSAYGDNFYVTNTSSTINLDNNTITNTYSDDWYFLRAQKDGWGKENKNGGHVTLNANDQYMIGDIYVDDISTVVINMTGTSRYVGTINAEKNTNGCSLSLASTSTMNLLGDCYLTSFTNAKSDNSNITTNGNHIYVYESGSWVAKV